MLTFEIHLQPKSEAEQFVTHRFLEIVQGTEVDSIEVPVEQLVVGPYFGEHNMPGTVRIWNVTDTGNHSAEPRVLDFVLKDPFLPPTPGEPTVVVTGRAHAANKSYRLARDTRIDVTPADGVLSDVVTVQVTNQSAG